MRLKTNIIISVLFLALLAFVYFYEIKGGEERRAEAEKSKQLLDISEHEATRLSVVRPDTMIILEKGADTWAIVAPVTTDADDDAVERYLRNLKETEIERTVEDSAAASKDVGLLNKYGLDEPRLKILLELSEGTADSVRFGSDSPTERFAYAQKSGDDPRIFTIRAWRFDNLNKSVFDLRDKRVLPFNADDVREIHVSSSAGSIDIIRDQDGGSWLIQSPVRRRADREEVDGLLKALEDGEAEDFASESPSTDELDDFGLGGTGSVGVSLLLGSELAEKRLAVGEALGVEGRFYARDFSRPQVFVVDSTIAAEVSKSLYTFRDKRISPINDRDAFTAITLLRDGDLIFSAHRDTGNVWVIDQPEERKAKSWKLNGMLTDLASLEAIEFAADADTAAELDLGSFGLDMPLLSVVAQSPEETIDLSFADDGSAAYAVRKGVATVCVITHEALENLEVDFDDVAQKAPKKEETTPAVGADSVDAASE